jgi:hypothetical protein
MTGGILSVKPFRSNRHLFSFYKIDFNSEIGCVEVGIAGRRCLPWVEELMSFCENPTVGIVLVADERTRLGRLKSGGHRFGDTEFGSVKGHNIITTDGFYRVLPSTTVHELGHVFGLEDEYISAALVYDDALGVKENCDDRGCPSWCSGELNTNSGCYEGYIGFIDCMREKRGEGGPVSHDDSVECANMFPGDYTECDLGLGCEDGTGCYPNCNGWGIFRSVKTGLMSYYDFENDPENYRYGLVGERIMCQTFEDLTHDAKGLCDMILT